MRESRALDLSPVFFIIFLPGLVMSAAPF